MNGEKNNLKDLARSPGASASGPAGPAIPAPRYRWKTRLFLPLAVLGAAGSLLGYAAREALTPAIDIHAAPVLVRQIEGPAAGDPAPDSAHDPAHGPATPAPSRNTATVQAPGWVEADPFAINVASLAGGVVREVLALEGERIEAGQVVARLIDDDARLALAAAEAELLERQGEIASAEADLHAAKTRWDNPFERQLAVNTSEAMVAESRAELVMLASQIETESARAQEIREEYQRLLALRESRALAEGDLVRWEQRLRAQEGVLAAARANRAVLESRQARLEAELAAARRALELRIEELRALKLAEAATTRTRAALERARVRRDEARLQLERMEITSPASGVVLTRLIEPGMRLMTSDDMTASLVLRLYDPRRLQVRVDVPLADAMRIGVGQEAEIITEAMPEQIFRGRISRLVHEANIQKNTVQVKVAIDPVEDDAFVLRPEMLTRVRFIGSGRPAQGPSGNSADGSGGAIPAGHQLLVPRQALGQAGADADGKAQVWVIDEVKKAAALREVLIGPAHGDWVEVREGLKPGDRVIVGARGGPANLRDGTRVNVMADRQPGAEGGLTWR